MPTQTEVPRVTVGPAPPELGARDRVMAGVCYTQGGRRQIDVAMTVSDIVALLPRPDPTRPLDYNRKVEKRRAQQFANYLISRERWISPSVIVRIRGGLLGFDRATDMEIPGNVQWGFARIPQSRLHQLTVLDGQHRILGMHMAVDTVDEKIGHYRELSAKAREQDAPELANAHEDQLRKWEDVRHRLDSECVVFTMVETDDDKAKQAFLDINNNAKGVREDFRVTLDMEDPLARIAVHMIESHPLLVGRVESGQSNSYGSHSECLMGAATVKKIVAAVATGGASVPRALTEELREDPSALTEDVRAFFDLLMNNTETMRGVVEGEISARSLHSLDAEGNPHATMLGSVTMLRVLAMTYHRLLHPQGTERPFTRNQVGHFFSRLEPFMRHVPVDPTTRIGQMWMGTGVFTPDSTAPGARGGQPPKLALALVNWANEGIPAESDARRRRAA